MYMGYLTSKQFSNKWGITERRIIKLCQENRITGAIKNGMVWLIPEDTMKPSDKRSKIAKYINTQKRVMIINISNELGYEIISLLKKEGIASDGFLNENEKFDNEKLNEIEIFQTNYEDENKLKNAISKTSKYYEGIIFIDIGSLKSKNKELIIREFSKKINSESSIVIVSLQKDLNSKFKDEFSKELKDKIGAKINYLKIDAPLEKDIVINYDEIAEDIVSLLTKFNNTTNFEIITDGGYIEFEKNGRTKELTVGKFYNAINKYLKRLNKESHMWCASTMLEDEWTEEPLEMNFRVLNLEVANRGANIERIFIFSKNKIKEFKENKTLQIYMQSNIKTMFVDYDEIKEKEPELLEIVGNGWDGIDKDTLIVDLPETSEKRGYISKNTKEILKAYNCFQRLKGYSKNLREVLK